MKKILLTILLLGLILVNSAAALTVADEPAAKELCNAIMGKVSTGDLDGAFKLMKPYIPVSETEIDSIALQTKTLREQFGKRYGNSIGYEFIDSKKVGDSLLRFRYIEKTNQHALPWVFYFFKSKDGWILNSFDWKDTFGELF